jgi:cobalt-zinc-cadmium resistance protein CzcA
MQLVRNGIGEEPITQKIEGVKRFGIVAKIRGAKEDIESLKNITIRSNSGVIKT